MRDSDEPLAFDPLADSPGLEIVDRIEQERCVCRTEGPVSPEPATGERFHFPIDHAVEITTSSLALPNVAGILVRNEAGEIVGQIQQLESERLEAGRYNLELLTQFKTYLSVESEVNVIANGTEFRIEFGDPTAVALGARSNHERPAATVRTTADPVDLMAAVETFSSALKTTKPDRAFPSLRGHPPSVELADSLDVPDGIERPETGITLELPARRDAVYVAAPLSYYLGAAIEPGPVPKLVTDDGFEFTLDGPGGFQEAVERVLKQVFFLDCVTRTEGLYKVDLHERQAIEHVVDLDFPDLYERSLQQQVEAYLDVPWEVVEEYVPDWRLTTHVESEPSTVEQLPFVVDDLAIVRTESAADVGKTTTSPVPAGVDLDNEFTRSANSESGTATVDYVEPEASDSLEQAWIGDDIPIGASKLTREAFENRLDRTPVDGDIAITIVLNDWRMDEERDLVDQAYGNRETLPFEVDVRRDVTTDELRGLLEQDTAFLHYIGHTEADGFECPDGKLDASTLDETGVQAFLLNACNSYDQGLGLIEAGAVGGIVTLNDVINDGAVRIGVTAARLLNVGFPLRSALSIARDESILGGQYIVVGDGGMTVAQPASGSPYLLKIQPSGDKYSVELDTYSTDVAGLGAIFKPFVEDNHCHFLSSGKTAEFKMSSQELQNFLHLEEIPVRYEGELCWSGSIDVESDLS